MSVNHVHIVVLGFDYEGFIIKGVYTSLEVAKKVLAELESQITHKSEYCKLYTVLLDSPCDI